MPANDRTGVGSGSAEWRTPPSLFEALNRRYAFDYDAFASHENALCSLYSTVDGTFFREMERARQVSDSTGLQFTPIGFGSRGRRRFGNPPYSRGLIGDCVEWFYDSRDGFDINVLLIPSNTETRWFQRWILPYCHIDWLQHRVKFIDPATGEPGGSPPGGSVIAVFKNDWRW